MTQKYLISYVYNLLIFVINCRNYKKSEIPPKLKRTLLAELPPIPLKILIARWLEIILCEMNSIAEEMIANSMKIANDTTWISGLNDREGACLTACPRHQTPVVGVVLHILVLDVSELPPNEITFCLITHWGILDSLSSGLY